MAKIRFHLDENVEHGVAHGLSLRGIEVTTSLSAGLLSASDEAQLDFATSEKCVLVTHDRDLLVLHEEGRSHCGIAFCAQGARGVGDMVRLRCLIYECFSDDEMQNHIEWL